MTGLKRLLSVADVERAARRRLPRSVYEFVRGGTEDEATLAENRRAFADYRLLPRGLNDVAGRDLRTALFGMTHAMPVGIAPTGLAGMVRHECDLALAGGARRAQVPFILSGSSNVPLERVLREAPDTWYQAYFPGDRDRIARILARLEAAGVGTLVVTADTCVAANRENNARRDFTIPFRLTPRLVGEGMARPRWTVGVLLRTLLAGGVPRFANLYEEIGPPVTREPAHGFRTGRDRLDWGDMAWLRERWRGRLVIKGLMHPDDARRAAALGADGIIVSNHGGRQLDGAASSLQALAAIAPGLPPDMALMVDSGFRRGTDIIKALALGARFVFVGRPTLFGAALAGEAGVRHVLEILRSELDRDLALLGCRAVGDLGPGLLAGTAFQGRP